jgi:uncharacterized protein YbaA (DUF1428 family)
MKTLLFAFASLIASAVASLAADDSKVYELRVYHANPGKLDALHARFRDHTVALFAKHGMEQLGYFVPVENKESNILVYWLAYPSKEARETAWKGFLEDPDWKQAYAESTKDGKLVGKVDSTFLSATDYSPASGKMVKKGDTRVFEWRTYTTNEGKLPNLHARFRDHTVALFEKHGITNVGYWTYLEGQDGAPVTLTYLVAHPDEAARDANFKAFGSDPAWAAARDASEKDGKLLIKDGVKSVLLKPTDYSPVAD